MDNYNYGIIGNCTSAALISDDASIDWLCLPFFDSPSVFGRLLGKSAGYFKITAVNLKTIKQSYIRHTPILKTTFETKDGVFEIRDFMPRFIGINGKYYCPSEIHRDLVVVSGKPRIIVELDPKPEYGAGEVSVRKHDKYIKIATTTGTYSSFYLYTEFDFDKVIKGKEIALHDKSYFVLSYHEKFNLINQERVYLEYEKTKSYWMDWSFSKKIPEQNKDLITRSLITLKLLMFQRTGAVVAAPTTSLPEVIGRERNWDYRFCWVRDASMMVDLYIRLGDITSANRFIRFIIDRMLLKNDSVTVMYGINGERELEEYTLDHLEGYMNSRPVRVGNAAYFQNQNDVYGELIETIYAYFSHVDDKDVIFNEEVWTAVRSLVRKVVGIWEKPDAGIWEFRGNEQHFVHSKLMCWVAFDRAAKIADSIGKKNHAKEYSEHAEKVKNDILVNGWDEKIGAFTMSYGSKSLDAANLMMLHYGFLPNDDERIIRSVKATYKQLVKNNLTFRYVEEDDFGAPENCFIVCTFWMINALYLIGEKGKAKAMLNAILSKLTPLQLMAEDVEIKSGRMTGNFPQGYSHLALIQTILLMQTDYDWTDV